MNVVTPDNLNVGFLREFMMLPTSYYATGAAIQFRKIAFLVFLARSARFNSFNHQARLRY